MVAGSIAGHRNAEIAAEAHLGTDREVLHPLGLPQARHHPPGRGGAMGDRPRRGRPSTATADGPVEGGRPSAGCGLCLAPDHGGPLLGRLRRACHMRADGGIAAAVGWRSLLPAGAVHRTSARESTDNAEGRAGSADHLLRLLAARYDVEHYNIQVAYQPGPTDSSGSTWIRATRHHTANALTLRPRLRAEVSTASYRHDEL